MIRPVLHLLSAASDTIGPAVPPYQYSRPFLQPLPVWNYWPWLLIPLCVAVAVVYKCIKCREARQVPKEASLLTAQILGGLALAAVALTVVVKLVAWGQS